MQRPHDRSLDDICFDVLYMSGLLSGGVWMCILCTTLYAFPRINYFLRNPLFPVFFMINFLPVFYKLSGRVK
ncbi:hypothetical protein J3R30DRAFT_1441091 [Lentinula aciculospora]|uniref:Uncharacterized protein n=1 Tax=Lentinula aciculospora TaxID=153920 RepID=A0A9W9APP5_9AGAR|nr:hypothetical protein J3R30DRAFT_1441091 [Lentinula aciculospora]